MDRYSSPMFHMVVSDQLKFLKFVAFLIVLFLISFFVSIPQTYSPAPTTVVSKLQTFAPAPEATKNPIVEVESEETNLLDTEDFNATNVVVQFQPEDQPVENTITVVDKIRLEEKENPVFERLTVCQIEDWNNITLEQIPLESIHRQWIESRVFDVETNEIEISPIELLAAFAHRDQIAVTLASHPALNNSVFCRYYDCKRRELVRQKPSFVFPTSTVYCPRRAGAKFISLTEKLEDKPQYPVPIVPRLNPSNFFSVCVSIDLNTTSYFEISEFIEYYKLQGASFFHIYLNNLKNFNRMILDDYVRTGDIQVILAGNTEEQANDCHHRNKYFSKWTANLQLQDRLQMIRRETTVAHYLDSISDPNTNILRWTSNDTSRLIIRPERVVSTRQDPFLVYLGSTTTEVHESIGFLRVTTPSTPSNYPNDIPLDMPFRKELSQNTLQRVKWVHRIVDVDCQKKREASFRLGRNATCINSR